MLESPVADPASMRYPVTGPNAGADQVSVTVDPFTLWPRDGELGGAGTLPTTTINSVEGRLTPAAFRARTRRK